MKFTNAFYHYESPQSGFLHQIFEDEHWWIPEDHVLPILYGPRQHEAAHNFHQGTDCARLLALLPDHDNLVSNLKYQYYILQHWYIPRIIFYFASVVFKLTFWCIRRFYYLVQVTDSSLCLDYTRWFSVGSIDTNTYL